MQIKCPHRRFYRLAPVRNELSPQAAERFDKLALFDQLRRKDASQPTAAATRTRCDGASSTATPSAGAAATAAKSPARWAGSTT